MLYVSFTLSNVMFNRIFLIIPCFISQLRPCPQLEQDVLSDCLSLQQLQSSTSSHQFYNGKDGRSPALCPDIFTGTRKESNHI